MNTFNITRARPQCVAHRSRYQHGMSKWGWLVVMVLFAGGLTAILKLGPHYIDFEMVKGVADRLPAENVHADMSRAEVIEHFEKQFRVEGFRKPIKEVLKIERDREQTLVNIDYEIREHLFFNVDVVMSFAETLTFQ